MINAEQAHKMGIKFSYEEYCSNKDDYQEYGEWFLIDRQHAFLYYEPGKGKTYPAVAALREVAMNGKVLILSTADSINQMWKPEIEVQEILPENTVMMSFNKAIQENTKLQLLKIKWDVIIVDECHKVKSNNSQSSKLLYRLTKNVKYVWGLSGTPRGNSELDIFCQFHNLNVGDWGYVTYTQFVNTCCDTEKSWGPYGMFTKVKGINEKYLAGWERNLEQFTQRVTYEDGEMPDLNIDSIDIDYEATDYYKNAMQGVLMVDDYATTMTKLVAINKAQQACNHFVYYIDDMDTKVAKEIEPAYDNNKIKYLKNKIDGSIPVAIVYLFEQDLKYIKRAFPNSTENIADFKKGKCNILLLQCSRCESFNLQNCANMYFYTYDYSYIKFKQMLHRVWRRGQDCETKIEVLVAKNTVEEQIWSAISNKKMAADLFMSIKGVYNGR